MRPLDARPLRGIARWARLEDGRELYVLSCTHQLINPPRELIDVERNAVRCPYCVAGVDAIVPIERVPA